MGKALSEMTLDEFLYDISIPNRTDREDALASLNMGRGKNRYQNNG